MKPLVLAPLVMLALAGCRTETISPMPGGENLSGTVKQGLEGKVAEIDLNGKLYRGKWHWDLPTREQLSQIPYPHRRNFGEITLDLQSDDGSKMICSGMTHDREGDLLCTVDGKEYPVILK